LAEVLGSVEPLAEKKLIKVVTDVAPRLGLIERGPTSKRHRVYKHLFVE
jgi:hypothetical protein